MFKVTIDYNYGEEIRNITGVVLPADGPFTDMWVLQTEDGIVGIHRGTVIAVKVHDDIPDCFTVNPEHLIQRKDAQDIMFVKEMEHISSQDTTGVEGNLYG